jgi:hypothetical protein
MNATRKARRGWPNRFGALAAACLWWTGGAIANGQQAEPNEPAQTPVVGPAVDAADAVVLVVLGDTPARLKLRVTREGEAIQARWRRAFDALFSFHDADEDGWIDAEEAQFLPQPLELHRILAGQVSYGTPQHADWSAADADGDQRLGVQELTGLYGELLGAPVVGLGEFPFAESLNRSLIDALDANSDGRLTRAECVGADAVLKALDRNGDQLVGPGELAPGIAYPATAGTTMLPRRGSDEIETAFLKRFPLRRSGDRSPGGTLASRRQPGVSTKPAVTQWRVDVGGTAADTGRPHRMTVAGVRLELRTQPGRLPAAAARFRQHLRTVFRDADSNANDMLEAEETGNTQKPAARRLLREADRNRDGVLAWSELDRWGRTRELIAEAHVLLTVIDFGRGLFECLDADRDGGLSSRERRDAWRHFGEQGLTDGKHVRLDALPRQLLMTASAGHPKRFLAPYRTGPRWFRNLDRNGDGDVSAGEFIGPLTGFDALDSNADGLLSAGEATRSETVKR